MRWIRQTCQGLLLPALGWAIAATGILAIDIAQAQDAVGAVNDAGNQDRIERGRYLTRAANCKSCHTTERGRPFAGGVEFDTPLGTLYSTNITPDDTHGIGQWSDDEFVRALHEGVGRNGEHLYPAFPYTAYTQLSRDDVLAIKAYLMAQPGVDYQPPANDMTFPFGHRELLWFWKWLNFDEGRFAGDDSRSAAWNRGAYLVEALGHCGQCHTPRTLTQGLDEERKFAGALQQGWRAYNITPHPTGIGGWSQDELEMYLATGHIPDKIASAGPMAEVVSDSLRFLHDDDIHAMAAYLRSVPPLPGDVPSVEKARSVAPKVPDGSPLAATMEQGALLFETACASCHSPDGGGPGGAYPFFPYHSAVRDPDGTNLINVLLQGLERHGSDETKFMPAYRDLMTDAQIAALATYVGRRFGGYAADFSAEDVIRQRQGGTP
ncbi:c-type cytochrome [Halomonas sp. McH1-25]|uniref:c-type cytochrome n=1 Tax=unclassified Halomonas TaxID=2609666 RepID=UPI001EF5EA27|nr:MULTISPECIES: cytochrome c [unclassified Halomonas]MCG7600217.1 c-type cytochrome [Halomonas sp. McH1-25]MCP1343090.1 c-type cytochrome [Halomonas sp. FL8]MCP1360501.1 c-type cytochrome [Halomonas sp. BBD45]MCP1366321.1 c-type cytochrome [Halomonas sp. BBD48]